MINLLRVGKAAQRQRGDRLLPAHNQADGSLNVRVGDGDNPEVAVQRLQPVVQRHDGAAHAALNRLNDLDDRYRGVFGRRDVLFMNEDDMAQSGLEHGDRVDIETALPGSVQRLKDITVVAYNIAPGTVGAYYPEANVLVPLDYLDKDSGTPSYKSVPVRITLRSKEIRML